MTLEWVAHPARRRPARAAIAVCVVALVVALARAAAGTAMAALVAIVLLQSIAPFLFPTRYRLDDDGVTATRLLLTRRRRWSEIRRVDAGRDAALLSPFARPSWLDRTRGLLVLFGDRRDEVLGAIREHVRC